MQTGSLTSRSPLSSLPYNQVHKLPPKARPTTKETLDPFWGLSPAMAKVRDDIQIASRHDIHTLVIGETGTGKELVAKELHQRRRERLGLSEAECPFVAVNSGAVPEGLAESILFGHERGAFTSARDRQLGKFELASKGTLFLDEIQSLTLATQIKLLRVVQSGDLDRLGSKAPSKMSCQVVAATNIPLEFLIERKIFRSDLYFRLNISPIYLPALRHRLEDLPLLIKTTLQRIRSNYSALRAHEISSNAFELLLSHSWPGNIRELEHALLYAAFRCDEVIDIEHLPGSLTGKLESYLSTGSWSL